MFCFCLYNISYFIVVVLLSSQEVGIKSAVARFRKCTTSSTTPVPTPPPPDVWLLHPTSPTLSNQAGHWKVSEESLLLRFSLFFRTVSREIMEKRRGKGFNISKACMVAKFCSLDLSDGLMSRRSSHSFCRKGQLRFAKLKAVLFSKN